MSSSLELSTTWGAIRANAAGGRIIACSMPTVRATPRRAFKFNRSRVAARDARDRKVLRDADKYLRALFAGAKHRLPALAIPGDAPFLRRAWQALLRVPMGQTISYGDLARRSGSPRAYRAAGQACARNRIPLFIPCHRVLAGSGRLGGFSVGLAWKKLLLEAEGSAR